MRKLIYVVATVAMLAIGLIIVRPLFAQQVPPPPDVVTSPAIVDTPPPRQEVITVPPSPQMIWVPGSCGSALPINGTGSALSGSNRHSARAYWQPGYWQHSGGQFQWEPGHWAAGTQGAVVAQKIAPPAPIVETQPAPPAGTNNLVWSPGHWEWRGTWVWIAGQYVVTSNSQAVWVPGEWDSVAGGAWRWNPALGRALATHADRARPGAFTMAIMSGLSGNEIYCLHLKGLRPGELVIGNSVYSLGFLGGVGSFLNSIGGGEVTQVTATIHEGRQQSYDRMMAEARERGGIGVTGVTSELKRLRGNIEFLSVGSSIHGDGAPEHLSFSTSGDGQQLYCQLDAGYTPLKFVFGNIAYSIGVGGSLLGGLKSLARGEIKEYSNVFNHTRHLALERIVQDARTVNANAVVGIETRVLPFQGVHEMMMLGTASHNPRLPENHSLEPVTSDLTCEEMWNLTNMGYYPLKLVLGTAVYSLGVVGGLKAMFKSLTRGEINDLTTLIYDAREHAIGLISDEANSIGADDVVGIKTHIHEYGSLIEFMAIGTAIKKLGGLTTLSPVLPPQAIMKDKDTWISEESQIFNVRSNETQAAKK